MQVMKLSRKNITYGQSNKSVERYRMMQNMTDLVPRVRIVEVFLCALIASSIPVNLAVVFCIQFLSQGHD